MTPLQSFLTSVPSDQHDIFIKLDSFIRKHAPKLKPYNEGKMLGYGRYHYRYTSGREGDWFTIGLRHNKDSLAVYVTTVIDGKYLTDTYADQLKASVGKSCIRFKQEEDIDWEVLAEIIAAAAKHYTPEQRS